MSLILTCILILSISGCGSTNTETGSSSTTTPDPDRELLEETDWDSLSDIESVDAANEVGTGSLYETGKTAGKIKALCYYDFRELEEEITELFATRYGGVIDEMEVCASGSAHNERLAVRITSGDSPDLVRYDWEAFPHGVSKNLYTPLDDWLDMDSPLWVEEKSVIEAFTYGGKHYYYPSALETNFMINYNRAVVEKAGLDDPLELYLAGDWTWDSFRRLCSEWALQGDEYIAFNGGSWCSMMFLNTTGTSFIEIKDNQITNNLKTTNAYRTMEWVEDMKKQGYVGDGFIHPGEAFLDGYLLFLGMGPAWTYESAQEALWKNNIEVDMVIVPFPRDPQADKYYTSVNTRGFFVPAGSENIQGGVAWILSARLIATDADLLAKEKAEKTSAEPAYYDKCGGCKYSYVQNNTQDLTVCPECNEPRKEKYKLTFSEQQYDLFYGEYIDSDKFEFVFDFANGFHDDFINVLINGEESVLDGPMYYGSSYVQLCESYYNTIESYLQPYRDAMASSS